MTATATKLTTADVAAELGTTPRELRKYLRSADKGVGKGSRYALPGNAKAMTALRKKFDAWSAAAVEAKAAKDEVAAEGNDEVEADETD
jgi:predicted transcriptional regulator